MKKINFLSLTAAIFLMISCSRYLDEKSDSSLATPETLEDNQAMLDRYYVLGINATSGEICADDIYVSDADFNTMPTEPQKRLYTWQPDHVSLASGNDWENCFAKINIFNTVLYNIDHYQISNADNLKGQALVFRAASYLEAAQIWCLAYDQQSASTRKGLPLRLDPDLNIPSVRSSLQQTYDHILSDLHTAVSLLPVNQIAVSRPSKVTALGYLTRAYLYMGDYENALKYGKEALLNYNTLMDYNSLNAAASYPFKEMNEEVLLPTSMAYSPFLTSSKAKVDPALYQSYHSDDLRKILFFRILPTEEVLFKGNYSGSSGRMTCIATDELYLSVAEAYAQLNKVQEGMEILNQLLIKRWKAGTFIPFTATTRDEAVALIRKERRKELLFRGLRWADVKRYNREGANIVLSKTVNGETFLLLPNDLRYAIAIPEDIIGMTGMPQNDR